MKNSLLSALFLFTAVSGFSTTWTVTSPGFFFSPDTLTITLGDSVQFALGPTHTGMEVSQSTWNTNGNTSNGGFNTPLGGGLVLPAQLPLGTHWYVCANHYFMGMKGVVIVNPPVGVLTPADVIFNVQPFPNPSMNKITVIYKDADAVIVYDMLGNKVKSVLFDVTETRMEIDMTPLPQGVYFFRILKEGVVVSTKKIVKS